MNQPNSFDSESFNQEIWDIHSGTSFIRRQRHSISNSQVCSLYKRHLEGLHFEKPTPNWRTVFTALKTGPNNSSMSFTFDVFLSSRNRRIIAPNTLIDTGANTSVIHVSLMRALGLSYKKDDMVLFDVNENAISDIWEDLRHRFKSPCDLLTQMS